MVDTELANVEKKDGIGSEGRYTYDFFLNNYRLGYWLIAIIVIGVIASPFEPIAMIFAGVCGAMFALSPIWVELTFMGIIEPIPVRYLLVRIKNRKLIFYSSIATLAAIAIRWAIIFIKS